MSVDLRAGTRVDVLAPSRTAEEAPRAVARLVAVVSGAEAEESTDALDDSQMAMTMTMTVVSMVAMAASAASHHGAGYDSWSMPAVPAAMCWDINDVLRAV